MRATLPAIPMQSAWPLGGATARRIALVLVAFLCLVAAALAVWSDGNYMDDEVTHYLIARWAWGRPSLLTDEWGRPGFTIPYALVAWIGSAETGFLAARLLTVGAMAATLALTWTVAHGLRVRHAWTAPLLLAGMPLYFHLSYTTSTETIAALYAIGGTYLLMRQRYAWAAVVLALMPITRHELVVLLVPVGLWLLWRRRFAAVALLAWAEVVWNAAVWAMGWQPPGGRLPIERFFATNAAGPLGYGSPIHFIGRWWDLCGIVIAGLSLAGAVGMIVRISWHRRGEKIHEGTEIRRTSSRFSMPAWFDEAFPRGRAARAAKRRGAGHRRRMKLLVAGGALGLVLLHTWLYMVNTHLSGGYARFLAPAAPWMAICAAWAAGGLVRLIQRGVPPLPQRGRWTIGCLALAAAFSLLPRTVPHVSPIVRGGLVILLLGLLLRPRRWLLHAAVGLCVLVMACEWLALCRPHRLTAEQRLVRDTVTELRAAFPHHLILGSTPWIEYFQDTPVNLPRWHDPLPWDPVRHPRQTLYILESSHGNGKHFVLESLETLPHRVVLEKHLPGTREAYLRVYERVE